MRRRILAALLALCMVLGVLPGTARAAETWPTSGNCGGTATWRYEATEMRSSGWIAAGTLTVSGSGVMEEGDLYSILQDRSNVSAKITVIIEEGITGISCNHVFRDTVADIVDVSIPESVTSIEAYSFERCESLTEIKLPSGLRSIGNSAFSGCKGLTGVEIPDSVTSMGSRAFFNCSNLASVKLSRNLTSIESGAFAGCEKLTDIELPDKLLAIGNGAFSDTALSSIFIPASIIRLDDPFYISSLNEINVDPNNREYSSKDGVLYSKEGTTLVRCPMGKASCTIPSTVTAIGDVAFYGCSNLLGIIIPDKVETIGLAAFGECAKLSSITIPDSVTSIGRDAFSDCIALTSISLPGSISRYFQPYFAGCKNLTTVTCNEGVTSISYAFSNLSSLTTVYLPASLREIGKDNFANCVNLKTIVYAGTEVQWGQIAIAPSNPEIGLAEIVFMGTGQPDNPDIPNPPDTPDNPDGPDRLPMTSAPGGLGSKVTVQAAGGHWLTVQVRRAGSIAVMSVQVPGSGAASMTFSASNGSVIQVWETEAEMVFENGVPVNPILAVNVLRL